MYSALSSSGSARRLVVSLVYFSFVCPFRFCGRPVIVLPSLLAPVEYHIPTVAHHRAAVRLAQVPKDTTSEAFLWLEANLLPYAQCARGVWCIPSRPIVVEAESGSV